MYPVLSGKAFQIYVKTFLQFLINIPWSNEEENWCISPQNHTLIKIKELCPWRSWCLRFETIYLYRFILIIVYPPLCTYMPQIQKLVSICWYVLKKNVHILTPAKWRRTKSRTDSISNSLDCHKIKIRK